MPGRDFDKLKQPRAYNEAEFMKQYNQGRKEYAAALIAEGYKAQNDADGFEEKTLDVIDFPKPTSPPTIMRILWK